MGRRRKLVSEHLVARKEARTMQYTPTWGETGMYGDLVQECFKFVKENQQ